MKTILRNRYYLARPTVLTWTGVLVAVAALSTTSVAIRAQAETTGPKPSSAIILLREGVDPEVFAREHGLHPEQIYRELLNGFSVKLPPFRAMLATDARLLRIEPDLPVSLPDKLEPGIPHELSATATGISPSFPPWGIDRIDQRRLPLDHAFRSRLTGKGVTVYVVDTGIRYDHSEFEGRAAPAFDAYRGEKLNDAYRGENLNDAYRGGASTNAPGSDCNGHGTHVAAIIGGRTTGVARAAQLRSVRVLGCDGIGSTSALLAGLEWISTHRAGPSVVNYSIVGATNPVLDSAVSKLMDSGVVMIAAAGNNGGDACQLSPGRVPKLITVGASDSADRRWSASNWGSCVSWFAPGSRILSAAHTGTYRYLEMSGTSMAAPHVAGVAALELERRPEAVQAEIKAAILRHATPDVIGDARGGRNALLFSGDDPTHD